MTKNGAHNMKIAIGCDFAGIILKPGVIEYLKKNNIEYKDFGVLEPDIATSSNDAQPCDYTDYAALVAKSVATGEFDRGILLCGTGIGMSIAANKINGIRAAVCHDEFTARATSAHNNSNVLCLGGRVIAPYMAPLLLAAWLDTPFEGGRHQVRIDKIAELEN